jgi:hypothetical protein
MKAIFCTALILFGVIGIFAQERTISKEESVAVQRNPNRYAPVAWRGKTYRWIFTTETKQTGKKTMDLSGKFITEFTPNQIYRSVRESRNGTKITKTETIKTRDKIYERNENGTWTVKAVEETPKTTNDNPPPALTDNKTEWNYEYKYLGAEKFNNQTTNVYVEISRAKTTDPSGKIVGTATHTRKYWFNEDGTVLKEDYLIQGQNQTDGIPGTFYNRMTQVYELDPKIWIEIPVVN